MEQIRAPQAAPEWPSAELGIDEKRSLRKGVKSAFKLCPRLETAVLANAIRKISHQELIKQEPNLPDLAVFIPGSFVVVPSFFLNMLPSTKKSQRGTFYGSTMVLLYTQSTLTSKSLSFRVARLSRLSRLS